MYGQNQMHGLGGYLGEIRQAPDGQLYQLGEVIDERGNIGLGWQPYDQPQLGEVRRGADGQLYQYGVDGLGNVGFAPLVALASKALPAIANIIPGVSNLVRGLIPGGLPGPVPPVPAPPVSATVSVPAPMPMPMPMPSMYPRPGLRAYLNSLVPRIAETTAQMVAEKLQPTLSRRRGRGRGRRGVAGMGEGEYPYGMGEDPYGIGENENYFGENERDLSLGYDDLGENDPYMGEYAEYGSLNGIDGYQRQESGSSMDGYVKGPISTGPAFVSRETASELWKPLW